MINKKEIEKITRHILRTLPTNKTKRDKKWKIKLLN